MNYKNSAVLHLPIEGAQIHETKVHEDERGFFSEITRQSFKQINMSVSHRNTLRGMHFQKNNPQGKLISVASGIILDVAIDLRKDSPTFQKTLSVELSGFCGRSLYIPPGCAHGFLVLSETATVIYACTEVYDQQSDAGIHYKSFGFDWPVDEMRPFFISERDRLLPTMDDYLKSLG